MYADNEYRAVAVLNRKATSGQQVNALGHLALAFGHALVDSASLDLLEYRDADDVTRPLVSRWPFIVLQAKNSNQLRSLREALQQVDLPSNSFFSQMVGESAESQIETTRATRESDLEYVGVMTFGPTELVRELTTKFSLYRGPS